MQRNLFGGMSGRHRHPAPRSVAPRTPLVVAIHGGTYTSGYFDVPGCSLLDLAGQLGIPVIAPDRPGYGDSATLPQADSTVAGQAAFMQGALADAWERHGEGTAGVVLIGHSIGGAVAATLAAALCDAGGPVPLLGLALSGVGMRTPPEHKPMWEALPDVVKVDMPGEVKDRMMFGPPGSFDDAMVRATDPAGCAAPKAELVDIVSTWEARAPSVLGRIRVPVHYRQGEFDRLWIVSPAEIAAVAAALSASPRVDAAMMEGSGHCLDFHHVGRSFQLQQLAFALQCASELAER